MRKPITCPVCGGDDVSVVAGIVICNELGCDYQGDASDFGLDEDGEDRNDDDIYNRF